VLAAGTFVAQTVGKSLVCATAAGIVDGTDGALLLSAGYSVSALVNVVGTGAEAVASAISRIGVVSVVEAAVYLSAVGSFFTVFERNSGHGTADCVVTAISMFADKVVGLYVDVGVDNFFTSATATFVAKTVGKSLVGTTATSIEGGTFGAAFVSRWDSVSALVNVLDTGTEAVGGGVVSIGVVSSSKTTVYSSAVRCIFIIFKRDGSHGTADGIVTAISIFADKVVGLYVNVSLDNFFTSATATFKS